MWVSLRCSASDRRLRRWGDAWARAELRGDKETGGYVGHRRASGHFCTAWESERNASADPALLFYSRVHDIRTELFRGNGNVMCHATVCGLSVSASSEQFESGLIESEQDKAPNCCWICISNRFSWILVLEIRYIISTQASPSHSDVSGLCQKPPPNMHLASCE